MVSYNPQTRQAIFLRYNDDVEQVLDPTHSHWHEAVLGGMHSYTGRPNVSQFPRTMMPEELDDFYSDISAQLRPFIDSALEQRLQESLKASKDDAEKQTSTHMAQYSFLRYFDTFPYEARVLNLRFAVPSEQRFLEMFEHHSRLYCMQNQTFANIEGYVPNDVLDSFVALYREARDVFSRTDPSDRVRYKTSLGKSISLLMHGNPTPPELQKALAEEEFPEFRPEMGVPILRTSYATAEN